MKFRAIGVILLPICLAAAAQAQEAGMTEYMNACATCHGEGGAGDGPLAEFLTVTPADLTQISAQNDGAFPLLKVIQTIDGRAGTRGHGGPMPVWGARFKEDLSGEIGAYASEIVTRGRILALAEYVESLQAQ
ncbi:c-type cytochrome [Yangia mangrovi]|uniref:3-methyladenine DNA glycosylase n=2 Tax=Alloyangia mangrovi TaxID=1779329 RepID=A0A2A3JTK3_9RHOB|nr:c-type cytochrome [Alloyangia mangrovi]